jgi:hypothetical protein
MYGLLYVTELLSFLVHPCSIEYKKLKKRGKQHCDAENSILTFMCIWHMGSRWYKSNIHASTTDTKTLVLQWHVDIFPALKNRPRSRAQISNSSYPLRRASLESDVNRFRRKADCNFLVTNPWRQFVLSCCTSISYHGGINAWIPAVTI